MKHLFHTDETNVDKGCKRTEIKSMTLPEIGLQINYFNTKKLVKISLFILILFTVANRVLLKKFTRSTMDNLEPLSFRVLQSYT